MGLRQWVKKANDRVDFELMSEVASKWLIGLSNKSKLELSRMKCVAWQLGATLTSGDLAAGSHHYDLQAVAFR